MREGTGAGVYGQSLRRRLSFALGRYTTFFQAEIYAILACVYKIQFQNRPEKYVSICSDSQAALKALRPSELLFWTNSAKRRWMTSLPDMWWDFLGPWTCRSTRQCNRRWARNGWLCSGIFGPEPALGVSRRDIQKRLSRWLIKRHCASWSDFGNTPRQARELISEPSLGAKAKFLSFNRTQSRAVTGLLTGHNTLRRHLHLLGLLDTPLCRGCGVKEETSAHILCDCETLTSLRHKHLGSFFWSRRLLRV